MAMIKQYQKKNGDKAWYFKTYLGLDPLTGKKKYTTKRGFKTQKEAKIALARLEINTQSKPLGLKKAVTFEVVYKDWLEQYKNTVKESTFFVQKKACDLHILPLFGKFLVDKIDVSFCQKQVNYWYSYYKKYSNLISLTTSILGYAITMQFIEFNPMEKVIRPKRKKEIDEKEFTATYYNKDELLKFLSCVKQKKDNELLTMFTILAFTGMRKGELLALRWKDINFLEQTISVKQTLTTGNENKLIFQTPKTSKSLRKVSIDIGTVGQLKIWKTEQKRYLLSNGLNSNSKDQLLFTNEKNEPRYLDYVNHNLNIILKQNNLKKITVHGFRHTHCSLLFESGASIKEVQDRLGHTDIKTTMDIYTHVTKKAKEKTADNFAKFLQQ